MNRPLVTALVLALVTLPVAAGSVVASKATSSCPGVSSVDADPEARETEARPTAPNTQRLAQSGGEAGAQTQRPRPRWQSFLPGMIR